MKELTKAILIILGSIGLYFIGLSNIGAWSLIIIYVIWITRQQH
jgi:hypothetical protein